jgi:hypothetical protein
VGSPFKIRLIIGGRKPRGDFYWFKRNGLEAIHLPAIWK